MDGKSIAINNAASAVRPSAPTRRATEKTDKDFSRIFEQAKEKEGVKFSKHAKERMISRDIHLSQRDMSRIAQAMDSLDKKGGKTSLVFFGNTTFVTNVESRTIITALDHKGEAQKVFTQIDSAVLVDNE